MKVTWSSPSNIALVKYWGKHGDQLPNNPSISFSLSQSKTIMSIEHADSTSGFSLDYRFEGRENPKFSQKIENFLTKNIPDFPWLKTSFLKISSLNTFPHSAGIASSASSMSALCLCLLTIDQRLTGKMTSPEDFFRKASNLARRASGSASRSVYGGTVSWGEIADIPESSNLYSTELKNIDQEFRTYNDSILIVDSNEKSVSSREGHSLMQDHPYAQARYKQANANIIKILNSLKSRDVSTFVEVVEEEALALHALMMTSNPSYILLKPETLMLIELIREYRTSEGIEICFTIDAGPNIHLLYPDSLASKVEVWINDHLKSKLPYLKIIKDKVGKGPELMELVD